MDAITTTLVIMGAAGIGVFVALAVLYLDSVEDCKARQAEYAAREIREARRLTKLRKEE